MYLFLKVLVPFRDTLSGGKTLYKNKLKRLQYVPGTSAYIIRECCLYWEVPARC